MESCTFEQLDKWAVSLQEKLGGKFDYVTSLAAVVFQHKETAKTQRELSAARSSNPESKAVISEFVETNIGELSIDTPGIDICNRAGVKPNQGNSSVLQNAK